MWLILPGWGLAPDDYAPLAKGLGSDANVVDSWRTPTTGDISAVRAALGADDSEIDLIGHSIGGLAAVEWALRYPEQIGRLVLLDPTTPRRRAAERTASYRAAFAGRTQRGRHLIGAVGAAASPVGKSLRRAGIRLATKNPDSLPSVEADARYGTAEAWRLLANQLYESREQEGRVARLLATRTSTSQMPPAVHLVGAGSRTTQRRFLRAQWELSQRLPTHIVMLPGQNHLFPVTRPDLVLHHIERM